jgi:hypothetical protein
MSTELNMGAVGGITSLFQFGGGGGGDSLDLETGLRTSDLCRVRGIGLLRCMGSNDLLLRTILEESVGWTVIEVLDGSNGLAIDDLLSSTGRLDLGLGFWKWDGCADDSKGFGVWTGSAGFANIDGFDIGFASWDRDRKSDFCSGIGTLDIGFGT